MNTIFFTYVKKIKTYFLYENNSNEKEKMFHSILMFSIVSIHNHIIS